MGCVVLFLVHQVLQYMLNIRIALADAYLDNLLAMPIILTLLVAERRHLFKRGPDYRLPLLEVGLATLYISMVSELLFPLLSSRFTFDLLDYFFFISGAVLFIIVNRESAKTAKAK